MITIVSGLPRSGTSVMMRMLESGGMPILADHVRKADEDNPAGYFELEAVKQVEKDASFLDGAEGKVLKMVSPLLFHLPNRNRYRILFMERNLDEMTVSQDKMLQRRGEPKAEDPEKLRRSFNLHLERVKSWLKEQEHISVLFVSYNRVLAAPETEVDRTIEFLGGGLNRDKMLAAVDPSLYRNRS